MSREFRIPAGKVKYDNWEMPDLTGVQRSIDKRLEELKQEEEAQLAQVETTTEDAFTPPTLEELEQLRAEFEAEGRAEGLQKGLEEGRAQGFEEGKNQGYEEGYQAGYNEGIAAAREVIEGEIIKWQNLQEQIIEPLRAVDEDVELAIVELIKLISTGILRRELNLDRSEVRNIVREAINSLPDIKDRVNVRINPADVQIVESACEKSLEDYKIIPDENITKGGCILDMKSSLVNSTVERRYQALVDMIIGEAYPQISMKNTANSNQALGAGQFSNKNALEELQKLQRELQSTDFKSLVHKSLNPDLQNQAEANRIDEANRGAFASSQPTMQKLSQQNFAESNQAQTPRAFLQPEFEPKELNPASQPQVEINFSSSPVDNFAQNIEQSGQTPSHISQNPNFTDFATDDIGGLDLEQEFTASVEQLQQPIVEQTPSHISQNSNFEDVATDDIGGLDLRQEFTPSANSVEQMQQSVAEQTPNTFLDNDFAELESAMDDDFATTDFADLERAEQTAHIEESKFEDFATDDIGGLDLEQEFTSSLEPKMETSMQTPSGFSGNGQKKLDDISGDEFADLEVDQATVSNWLDGDSGLADLMDEQQAYRDKDRENVMQFPGQKVAKNQSSSSVVEGSYLDNFDDANQSMSIDDDMDDLVDLSAFDNE